MERMREGDPSALGEVLERYWRPLVAYATRLLPDRDAAEDIVQETMLRLWERRTEWEPSGRLRALLYMITRNLAINEQQRIEVRRNWAKLAGRGPGQSPPTPMELAERAELRDLLKRVIDELPPRRREIFILARYHGHSYREIAEVMNISPQTVANQMSAALDTLRTRLRHQILAFYTLER